MTKKVIQEKLHIFRGLTRELDDEKSQELGRLLIDEADEDVDPSREAYIKFYKFSGGMISITIVVVFSLIEQSAEMYEDSLMH